MRAGSSKKDQGQDRHPSTEEEEEAEEVPDHHPTEGEEQVMAMVIGDRVSLLGQQ